MHCKDCKHWSKNIQDLEEENDYRMWNDSPRELGLGRCLKVPELWESYDWKKPDCDSISFTDEVIERNDLAFVKDGSDYLAELYTLPNFGCVMFSTKEN